MVAQYTIMWIYYYLLSYFPNLGPLNCFQISTIKINTTMSNNETVWRNK